MGITVFWIEDAEPKARHLASNELLASLRLVEELRKAGYKHVCISSELEDSVGAPGVSDVLPEGYDWKKRRV